MLRCRFDSLLLFISQPQIFSVITHNVGSWLWRWQLWLPVRRRPHPMIFCILHPEPRPSWPESPRLVLHRCDSLATKGSRSGQRMLCGDGETILLLLTMCHVPSCRLWTVFAAVTEAPLVWSRCRVVTVSQRAFVHIGYQLSGELGKHNPHAPNIDCSCQRESSIINFWRTVRNRLNIPTLRYGGSVNRVQLSSAW